MWGWRQLGRGTEKYVLGQVVWLLPALGGHSVEGPGMFKGTVKGLPCATGNLPAVLGIQSSSGPRQLGECDQQTQSSFAPGSGEDSFNHHSSCSPEGRAPTVPKFP